MADHASPIRRTTCIALNPRIPFRPARQLDRGGPLSGCVSDPKEIVMKLHVGGGHASAQQLKRALVNSDGDNAHLANHVHEVPERC